LTIHRVDSDLLMSWHVSALNCYQHVCGMGHIVVLDPGSPGILDVTGREPWWSKIC